MFKGRYPHGLDAKGRVALPAVFRRELEDRGEDVLVLTPDIQAPCLVAYPKSEWEVFEQRVSALPQYDPSVIELRRRVVGSAQECPVDKVGRVLIPGSLRKFAGIEKELVWMGQLRVLEIWDAARLDAVAPMAHDVPLHHDTLRQLAQLRL